MATRYPEYHRQWVLRNRARHNAVNAAWRLANPEKVRASRKRRYERIKAEIAAGLRPPAKKRVPWKRDPAKTRARHLRRKASDPAYRLNRRVKKRIKKVLGEAARGQSLLKALGYTAAALCAHLERQFVKGMTWGNYGEWHVDHIVPLVSFRFSSVEDPEFRAAWALSNLRPMWAGENLRKGGRRLTLL